MAGKGLTPGLVLLMGGGLLVAAGWTNRSVQDTFLGLWREQPAGTNPLAGVPNALMQDPQLTDFGPAVSGLGSFDGKPVASWIVAPLTWARAHGWHGIVTSGYRTKAQQAAACAHTSGPCAEPGKSNHQKLRWPGGAVDVTDSDTLAALMRRYPGPGPALKRATFAGDPIHFSGNGH